MFVSGFIKSDHRCDSAPAVDTCMRPLPKGKYVNWIYVTDYECCLMNSIQNNNYESGIIASMRKSL